MRQIPSGAACGGCHFWHFLPIGYEGKGGWCMSIEKPQTLFRIPMNWVEKHKAPKNEGVWPITHCDMACEKFLERRQRESEKA